MFFFSFVLIAMASDAVVVDAGVVDTLVVDGGARDAVDEAAPDEEMAQPRLQKPVRPLVKPIIKQGSLRVRDVSTVIRAHKLEIIDCHDQYFAAGGTKEGRVSVQFVVDVEGRTTKIEVGRAQELGKTMVGCIEKVVRSFVFPKPKGGPVEVNLPLILLTKSAPIVKTKKLVIGRGSLTRHEIQSVVRTRVPEIKRCYDQYLRGGGTLEGAVTARFIIGSEGAVKVKAITPASNFSPTFRKCIERIVGEMQFPRPLGGGKVFVNYPFVFSADPGCGKGCPKPKTVAGILRSHRRHIRSCATSERVGTITVNFSVGRSGRSSKVYSENPDGFSRNVLRCVREKVQAIRFAPPRGKKSVQVHYPFEFGKSATREEQKMRDSKRANALAQ